MCVVQRVAGGPGVGVGVGRLSDSVWGLRSLPEALPASCGGGNAIISFEEFQLIWPPCVDGETEALRRDAPLDPVTHLSGELEHSSDCLSTPF